ncbi:hypothetical protein [Nonomuraea sp. NPDC049158]|uniref:hypothetical protein n=1 Tax=Nonomuraea sp. NPDC049158 TaxID=3155649 RepID=UPI0033EF8551
MIGCLRLDVWPAARYELAIATLGCRLGAMAYAWVGLLASGGLTKLPMPRTV